MAALLQKAGVVELDMGNKIGSFVVWEVWRTAATVNNGWLDFQ